jgi:hypothetical protein
MDEMELGVVSGRARDGVNMKSTEESMRQNQR